MRHCLIVHGVVSTDRVELSCARVLNGGTGKVFLKKVVQVKLFRVQASFSAERGVAPTVVNTEEFNFRCRAGFVAAWGVGVFENDFRRGLIHIKRHVQKFRTVGHSLVVLGVIALALEWRFRIRTRGVSPDSFREAQFKDFELPEVFWVHAALATLVKDVIDRVVLLQGGFARTNTTFRVGRS